MVLQDSMAINNSICMQVRLLEAESPLIINDIVSAFSRCKDKELCRNLLEHQQSSYKINLKKYAPASSLRPELWGKRGAGEDIDFQPKGGASSREIASKMISRYGASLCEAKDVAEEGVDILGKRGLRV